LKLFPGFNVSRETEEALFYIRDSVIKWNPTINLISKGSVVNLWDRHILDSAQIFTFFIPKDGLWLDFGSGGGFPGLVLAALSKSLSPGLRFVLVESDARKCSFLKKISRDLSLSVNVLNARVEDLSFERVDYISARAVSQLGRLLVLTEKFVSRETVCVFLKGGKYQKEVADARKNWDFELKLVNSLTSKEGKILILKGVERVFGE